MNKRDKFLSQLRASGDQEWRALADRLERTPSRHGDFDGSEWLETVKDVILQAMKEKKAGAK